jgi:hypothetical protein
MEKYVVSRELAEKLKDAGYPQKSIYGWADETKVEKAYYFADVKGYILLINVGLISDFYEHEYQPIAAPLSDELLEQLPDVVNLDYGFVLTKSAHLGGYACGFMDDNTSTTESRKADKPVDALAKLWLWCKENDHLPTLKPCTSKEHK